MAWLNPLPINPFGLIHLWAESAFAIFVTSVESSTVLTPMISVHCIIFFGDPYGEDGDVADYQVSLARLKLSFELLPCPEVEGAMGYAYWKLGQNNLAVHHCLSSLTQQPNHFGASKAFYVLRHEYDGFEAFAKRLKAKGHRIKSLREEFPGQRIRKPKK
jgi:hypothetical protein